MKTGFWAAAAAAALCAGAAPALAQETPDIGFESVGRAAPLISDIREAEPLGAIMQRRGFGPDAPPPTFVGLARGGDAPEGIEPLEVDLFTSDDFYADRELWSDPRYFRCSSAYAIENGLWSGGGLIENEDPATAPWGRCDRDMPREHIASPYDFGAAQAHYEALMEEARTRGTLTEHSYETVPGEWTGVYGSPGGAEGNWYRLASVQIPTMLSFLTPEYQERFVQETYHHGNTNAAQWPSTYCWPEGFMRRWHFAAAWEHHVLVTPDLVQILAGVARNFVTNIYVGREMNTEGVVPRLGADVPQWYGETVGFWDGDTLITWTSNIQGWKAHGAFEHSNKMQTVEIYTPRHDGEGNFLGLNHEAIFYDEDALSEPIRIVRNLQKTAEYGEEGTTPFSFVECVQTIFPVDGVNTPLSPGDVYEAEVLDMYGRPWADLWEEHHEEGMSGPAVDEDMFSFE